MGGGVTALLVSLALRTAAAEDPAPAAAGPMTESEPSDRRTPRDSDGDGLSDQLERRTDTDPFDADTDADSVPDGAEDRNSDGVVDPHESDPRRPGLFP